MTMWFRRPAPPPDLAPLRDALEQARRELGTLRHDVDELTARFRRWQGRVSKQDALDERDDEQAKPSPPLNRRSLSLVRGDPLPTLHELRRNGKLPW